MEFQLCVPAGECIQVDVETESTVDQRITFIGPGLPGKPHQLGPRSKSRLPKLCPQRQTEQAPWDHDEEGPISITILVEHEADPAPWEPKEKVWRPNRVRMGGRTDFGKLGYHELIVRSDRGGVNQELLDIKRWEELVIHLRSRQPIGQGPCPEEGRAEPKHE